MCATSWGSKWSRASSCGPQVGEFPGNSLEETCSGNSGLTAYLEKDSCFAVVTSSSALDAPMLQILKQIMSSTCSVLWRVTTPGSN